MTLSSPPAPRAPSTPRERAPAGACDTHVHMLAGPGEHPRWERRAEDPAEGLEFDGFMAHYRTQCETLGIERTVFVHSILYGTDNAVTLNAVETWGRDKARAVVLVSDDVEDSHLDTLRAGGATGVRLNYVHGGVLSFAGALAMAPRLAARGMHLQMLVHTDRHMDELAPIIRDLPVPVVIDHIGWPPVEAGPQGAGFAMLCRLVGEGHAYVKLSGLYRMCRAPYDASDLFVAALIAANPERCLWGSDSPYIMLKDAESPDAGLLMDAFCRVAADTATRRRIFVDNAAELYGF